MAAVEWVVARAVQIIMNTGSREALFGVFRSFVGKFKIIIIGHEKNRILTLEDQT